MERLFCSTIYVFNKENDQVLFMNHRKLGKWLPPGGKLDKNELPDDAALRETFEETGVNIKLIGERAPVQGGLIRPYGMQLNVVIPGVREHIDFVYLAIALDEKITINVTEASEVTWLPIKKVLDQNFNTFESVRTWTQTLSQELANIQAICTQKIA